MSEPTITFTIPTDLERVKTDVVRFTVSHFGGNKKLAAKALKISLKTIYNILGRDDVQANHHRLSRTA